MLIEMVNNKRMVETVDDKQWMELIKGGDKREVIRKMILERRNFGSIFPSKPATNLDFEGDIITMGYFPLIKVEQFLDKMCEFDEFSLKVNEMLLSNRNKPYNDMVDDLINEYEIEINMSGYTYGDDYNYLSRDVVYDVFKKDETYYGIIQVHYGADARIGFGEAICFKLLVNYEDDFLQCMELCQPYNPKTDEEAFIHNEDEVRFDEEQKKFFDIKTNAEIDIYAYIEDHNYYI